VTTRIDISNKSKAAVLVALHECASSPGLGILHRQPNAVTVVEAERLLAEFPKFDYLAGRVMKVDLGGNTIDPTWYDRDNGDGAAASAVACVPDENADTAVTA